ncbi:MAG: 4-phosphoerythronate dehydrogenase [Halioglobus sp.]
MSRGLGRYDESPAGAGTAVSLQILADENIPAVEHYLGHLGPVRRAAGRALEPHQLRDVDVLLVRSVTRVDKALLAGSPVRFVGTATSGLDHIDRAYLAERGIAFAYAPGSNANSVVEYVLAAIAAVGDKLEQLLDGGVAGIVGYGHIGKAVATRFAALGIRYRIHDPWLPANAIPNAATLDAVLDCDVVSLHPELTRRQPWPSYHLLGTDELRRLRPDALLVNASRGPVIDNPALRKQLDRGCGPLTVLDVWEGEPAIDRELLERVTLGTAHIAGYSLDGKLLATRMLSEAVAAKLALPPPPGDSPVAGAPPLAVSGTPGGAQLLRYLVQARYDIRLDDRLLQQALREHSAGTGFDALRKSYRDRRELAGSAVTLASPAPTRTALVAALGCLPVQRTTTP